MIITNIVEVSKSRSKIYIDEQFAFVLYKGELHLYQIEKSKELSQEFYEEIMHKVLPKRAKLRCMNLLKSRNYTEKQLRDKLREGFYPIEIIDEALEYVKSFSYVDDARYTSQYIEYQMGMKSRKRIELDLLRKGIPKERIDNEFANLSDYELEEQELMLIKKEVQKKKVCLSEITAQEKAKLYAFLFRKGFSAELIRKVLKADDFEI